MKHTPGPWKLCFHLKSGKHDASCPCGFPGDIWGVDGEHVVCTMGPLVPNGEEGMHPPRYPREEELANARLIAAAPEMLLALKIVVHSDMAMREEDEGEISKTLNIVREVIAKAEGKE